jgi:hypothetical protein
MRPIFTTRDQIAPAIVGKFVGQLFERHSNAHAVRLRRTSCQGTTVQLFGMVSSG